MFNTGKGFEQMLLNLNNKARKEIGAQEGELLSVYLEHLENLEHLEHLEQVISNFYEGKHDESSISLKEIEEIYPYINTVHVFVDKKRDSIKKDMHLDKDVLLHAFFSRLQQKNPTFLEEDNFLLAQELIQLVPWKMIDSQNSKVNVDRGFDDEEIREDFAELLGNDAVG